MDATRWRWLASIFLNDTATSFPARMFLVLERLYEVRAALAGDDAPGGARARRGASSRSRMACVSVDAEASVSTGRAAEFDVEPPTTPAGDQAALADDERTMSAGASAGATARADVVVDIPAQLASASTACGT